MQNPPDPALPGTNPIIINRAQDALLVIDLQPDFMPGGALAVAEGDQVVPPIVALLSRFHTVVATQDWHPPGHRSFASSHGAAPYTVVPMYGAPQTLWPDHCVQGTVGAALHRDLPQEPLDLILRKGMDPAVDSYSAFRENLDPSGGRRTTGLAPLLKARGVRRVFLCGLARDFCVAWSAIDAVAEGLEAVVLWDLTRAVFPDKDDDTARALREAGVVIARSADLAQATP